MAPSLPPLTPPYDAASLSALLQRIQAEYLQHIKPPHGVDPRAYVAATLGVDPVLMSFPRLRRLINLLFVLCPHPISFDFIEMQSALDALLPARIREPLRRWRSNMGFWSITRQDNKRFLFRNIDNPDEVTTRSKDVSSYHIIDFYNEPWTGNVALGWPLPISSDTEDPQNTVFVVGFVLDPVCLKQVQAKIHTKWNEKFHTLLDPLKRHAVPISQVSRSLVTPTGPDAGLVQTVAEALQRRDQRNGKLREMIARAVTPEGAEDVASLLRSIRHQVLSGIVKYSGRLLSQSSPNAEVLVPVAELLAHFGLKADGSMPVLDQHEPLKAQDALLLGMPPPGVLSALPKEPSVADVVGSGLWSEASRAYLTERRWLATWDLLSSKGAEVQPPPLLSYDMLFSAFVNVFSPDILETPLSSFLESRLLSLLCSQIGEDPLLLKHLPKTEANLLKIRGLGASRLTVLFSSLLTLALTWRQVRVPMLKRSIQSDQRQVQANASAQSALAEIQSLLGL